MATTTSRAATSGAGLGAHAARVAVVDAGDARALEDVRAVAVHASAIASRKRRGWNSAWSSSADRAGDGPRQVDVVDELGGEARPRGRRPTSSRTLVEVAARPRRR